MGTGEQLTSQCQVFVAGFNITRGMVVGDNESRCTMLEHFTKDIAGMGQGFGGGADRNHTCPQKAMLDIEHENRKALLGLPHEFMAEGGGSDCGIVHDRVFGWTRLEYPLTQLDRSENGSCFCSAHP